MIFFFFVSFYYAFVFLVLLFFLKHSLSGNRGMVVSSFVRCLDRALVWTRFHV